MGPVSRPDIVAGVGVEAPGRSQEAVHGSSRYASAIPAKNHREKVRVGQPASAAEIAPNVGRQAVLGDGNRGGRGIASAENPPGAHPDEAVHVHHDGVETAGGKRLSVVILRFIAYVEQQLVAV